MSSARSDEAQPEIVSEAAGDEGKALDDRRQLLKKLGRLGLYTAPALLLTFEGAKAVAPPSIIFF